MRSCCHRRPVYHVYVLCFLSRLGLPLLLGENRGSCLLEHLLLAIPTTLSALSALSALAAAALDQPAAALAVALTAVASFFAMQKVPAY